MRTTIYYRKTIWDRSQSFLVAVLPGVTSIFNSYTNYITTTLSLVYLLDRRMISFHKLSQALSWSNFHECSQKSFCSTVITVCTYQKPYILAHDLINNQNVEQTSNR